MKRCIQCGKATLERIPEEHVVEVAGRKFTGPIAVDRCTNCGETYTAAGAMQAVELEAARTLAQAGIVSGETFRFMRYVLGFTARALAEDLGTAPETISRWEHGERDVDPLAWAAVALLVDDRLRGETRTLDQLHALREPKKLAKAVRVDGARERVDLTGE